MKLKQFKIFEPNQIPLKKKAEVAWVAVQHLTFVGDTEHYLSTIILDSVFCLLQKFDKSTLTHFGIILAFYKYFKDSTENSCRPFIQFPQMSTPYVTRAYLSKPRN